MLNKSDLQDYYGYVDRYNRVFQTIKKYSIPKQDIVDGLCKDRVYLGDENRKRIEKMVTVGEICYLPETFNIFLLSQDSDLALFSNGKFILSGMYIIPIKDMLGNVLALVGWAKGQKYITTPSKYFVRSTLLFGLEQLKYLGTGKNVFLVEGIFDALAVRSLGLPCFAEMGIKSSNKNRVLYKLFGKITAIPDSDVQGRKRINTDSWVLPVDSHYLTFYSSEGTDIKAKDIDDVISIYESDSIKSLLISTFTMKERIIKVNL